MLDKRLDEWPSIYLLGATVFGALFAACVYLLATGAVTGVVMRAPGRHMGPWLFIYDRLSGDALRYGADLVGWGALATLLGAQASLCGWLLSRSGGLLGGPQEKQMRRIGQLRGRIDEAIFLHLANLIPGHWRSASLGLEWQGGQGEPRLRHSLLGPPDSCDRVQLPEELYLRTRELLDVFQKHDQAFRKTVYAISRGTDRQWKRTLTVE